MQCTLLIKMKEIIKFSEIKEKINEAFGEKYEEQMSDVSEAIYNLQKK